MTQTDQWEENRQKLRGDLLKLKANARMMNTQEWIDTALGIVEKYAVQREEALKLREFGKKRLGASIVEVRKQ